ncbi:MAG: LPS export ABC transporter ATP-binding protein [Legionellales bacterium]|nr:LPS export ABC transporter ATP-binding protein [Legionellales bacterium]
MNDINQIKLDQLNQSIKQKPIVKDISFSVSSGQIVGLLGSNGSGKTTTFNLISGLSMPTSGNIYLNDQCITALPTYQRARLGITYLPQEPSIFQGLTVRENLLAVLELTPSSQAQHRQQLELLLEEFQITHIANHLGRVLSGGERRRVEIARSIAMNPTFILMDEPFAGIDPKTIEEIKGLLIQLKHRSIGIIITDHNVTETLAICDECHIIHSGKIIASGMADEIKQNKQARKHYLGEHFSNA